MRAHAPQREREPLAYLRHRPSRDCVRPPLVRLRAEDEAAAVPQGDVLLLEHLRPGSRGAGRRLAAAPLEHENPRRAH